MIKSCEHVYGIWDNETSVIGRCIMVTNPSSDLIEDAYNFEAFKFCPHCGEQLIKGDK